MGKQQNFLTEGPVMKSLLGFTIPFLLANLLQSLYSAVDLIVIGHFTNDSVTISAVASGGQVILTVSCFIIGLTTGGTVLVGQFFGGNRIKEVNETVKTMITFFVSIAVVMTILMMFGTGWLASITNIPTEALAQAKQYIYISSAGIIFIFGYNMVSAILRGVGNSITPLLIVALACVFNLVGDLILVGGLQMGATGAAIATISAQGLSMIAAICYLKMQKFPFSFRFGYHKELLKSLWSIGMPIGLQELLVQGSFLFILSIINTVSVDASAAYGVVTRINDFAMLPALAFCMSLSAIIAQNMGAGKIDRAKKFLKDSILISFAFGIFVFLLLELAPEPILGIFSKDTEIMEAGSMYLKTFSIEFLIIPFVFCLNGFFNGCGHTIFSALNNVFCTFAIRIPAAYLLSRMANATLFHIGLAGPLASGVSVIIAVIYLIMGRWKKMIIHKS